MNLFTVFTKVNNALGPKQCNEVDIPKDWLKANATVTACKTVYYSHGGMMPSASIPMPNFVVKFSYIVDGRIYTGRFRSNTGYDLGCQFEISYNPQNPAKNSGVDSSPWLIWVVILLAIIIVAWENFWFHNFY